MKHCKASDHFRSPTTLQLVRRMFRKSASPTRSPRIQNVFLLHVPSLRPQPRLVATSHAHEGSCFLPHSDAGQVVPSSIPAIDVTRLMADRFRARHSIALPYTGKAQIVRTQSLGFEIAIRAFNICHVLRCCCGLKSDTAAYSCVSHSLLYSSWEVART